MKLSRPVVVNSTLAAVILAAAVGVYFVANPIAAVGSTETTQLTGTVQAGTVSSTITASGSIAAVREVSASFAVTGTIASINVALGTTITAGDPLGTVGSDDLVELRTEAYNDLADAQSDYADAVSSLSDANSDLSTAESTTTTSQSGEVTAADTSQAEQAVSSAEDQVDTAQDKVDTAADAVATAESNVNNTTLLSPITGLVVAINSAVGDTTSGSSSSSAGGTDATTTSTGFVTIADVSSYSMTANIAEADIASVAVGQAVSVNFPALDDATATAVVSAVSPVATASNSVVTYATTITLTEVPDGLRLGQTAEASITTVASAAESLYVPTAAITTATDGTSTVDVIGEDDEVTTTTVELGVVGDQGTEVTSGLTEGQSVSLGEVAASTTEDTGTTTEQGGFGGGTGGFTGGTGGGTPPSGTFPGQ